MRKATICALWLLALVAGCFRGAGSKSPENPAAKISTPSVEDKSVTQPKTTPDDPVTYTDEQWRKRLTPEQYRVCRRHGTEPAFTGRYHDSKKKGTYLCVACGNDLFDSEAKFDSGTGWPSFYQPIGKDHVGIQSDNSFFMKRTEVHCARCQSHLGHIFEDGPQPTGLRYCINSVALELKEKE